MTGATVGWIALGLMVGVAHAVLLRRWTRLAGISPAAIVVRLAPVSAALFAAAIAGRIVPVAAGWWVGFTGAVLSIALRRPA